MRIPNKKESLERYRTLKTQLKRIASTDINGRVTAREGDRIVLTQNVDFRNADDGTSLVFEKGSAIDDDVQTRDIISTKTTVEGSVQRDSYEHFSEKEGLIFKRDQEKLSVSYRDNQGFNQSHSSLTFDI